LVFAGLREGSYDHEKALTAIIPFEVKNMGDQLLMNKISKNI